MTKVTLGIVLSLALASVTFADPPTPAPETEQMRKWEGSWKTEATFAKGGMMPDGGSAKGSFNCARGLNGHAFLGDYQANGTGGEFKAHSIRMWDPNSKKWRSWWYDSWAPGDVDMSVGELAADGTFVTQADKGKLKTRITERWADDNKVEQVMEADLGHGWVPQMTIVYTRKNGKWKEPKPKAGKDKPARAAKGAGEDDAAKPDDKAKKSKKKKSKKGDDAKDDAAEKGDKSDKGDKGAASDKEDAPLDKPAKINNEDE